MIVITGITGTTENDFYLGKNQDGYKTIYAYNSDINIPGIRWNDNDNQWEFSNDGMSWEKIPEEIPIPIVATSGGTGQITYTTGDLLYSDGYDSLNKLAIGAANQTLKVSGGLPSWQNLTGVLVETGTRNVAGGTGALANITSGYNNTAFGYNAGNSEVSYYNNVFIGNNAGKNINNYNNVIISGGDNVVPVYNSNDCIIIGTKNVGSIFTSDTYNILIGNYVEQYAHNNQSIFIGNYCGQGVGSSCNYNIGFGYQAFSNTSLGWSVSECLAIGYKSFNKLTGIAQRGTAIGYYAGDITNNGTEQICIGAYSGYKKTSQSICIGSYSGGGLGSESVAIGNHAQFKTFNKAISIGSYTENAHHYSLVISGYGTEASPTQSKGEYTAVLGYHSLYLGKKVAEDITIYANNGAANLSYLKYNNITNNWVLSNDGITERNIGNYDADHNTLSNLQGGEYDGYYHLTEEEHTWLTDGYYSLRSGNVFIGESADGYQIDVENGIAIGKSASVGDRSIAIGYQAVADGIDRIAIGYGSTPTSDNTCYIGEPITNPIDLSAASYSNYSDIRIKKNIKSLQYGLEIINSLNPVEFYYDTAVGSDSYRKKHLGLIAQEVEKVSDIIEDWGIVLQDSDCWKLNYIQLISPLVKAIQQLNDKVEKQQEKLKE